MDTGYPFAGRHKPHFNSRRRLKKQTYRIVHLLHGRSNELFVYCLPSFFVFECNVKRAADVFKIHDANAVFPLKDAL
jgi:hypothetical protein